MRLRYHRTGTCAGFSVTTGRAGCDIARIEQAVVPEESDTTGGTVPNHREQTLVPLSRKPRVERIRQHNRAAQLYFTVPRIETRDIDFACRGRRIAISDLAIGTESPHLIRQTVDLDNLLSAQVNRADICSVVRVD
jgi:hypothetical protein